MQADQLLYSFRCRLCGYDYRALRDGAGSPLNYVRRYRDHGPGAYLCQFCAVERGWRDMEETGRTVLYLNEREGGPTMVGDCSGCLKIPVTGSKLGEHNWGIKRLDVWFRDRRGEVWWGVHYGRWNDVVYCRRLKPPSPRKRRRYYALEFGRGSGFPYREGGIPVRIVVFGRRAARGRWVAARPFNLAMRDGRTEIEGTGWVRDPGRHRAVQVWRVA